MKTIKNLILLFLLALHVSGNAQTLYTEIWPDVNIPLTYETINKAQFKNKYKGSNLDYSYTLPDGTTVRVTAYNQSSTLEVFEHAPYPAIHIVYKEFYSNGKLKQKGVFLPKQVKIGTWIEYDTRGKMTIIDHESNRKKLTYDNVLERMWKEGYYCPETYDVKWDMSFWYTPETDTWGVRVNKDGNQYKMYTFNNGNTEPRIADTEPSTHQDSLEVNSEYQQRTFD